MQALTRSSPERLESWKEIAAYLGRGVRTVQRWEGEEGLPVHRQHHNRLGTIYALKSELESWRAGREGGGPGPGAPRTAATLKRRSGRPLGWAVAGGVALVLLVTTHSTGRPAPNPADPATRRLAVVPFRNLTGDPSTNRLIQALSEDTLVEMHRIEGDRLAIVTGQAIDAESGDARRAAGVDYVLEGSVRQSGGQLRVAARLVREQDGSLLWVASYDRPSTGPPVAESGLGRSIASSVSATLRR